MNIFNKYVWLLNTLRRKRGATLEELRSEWYDSDLNDGRKELNPRTLSRWKIGVQDIFGIDIECDPARGYRYYIVDEDSLGEDTTVSWLLHTISVVNMLEEFKGERDKIILDRIPSGDQYLMPILRGIKDRRRIIVTYIRHQENAQPRTMKVSPLCVRLFERRWYAVVNIEDSSDCRLIALERIVSLDLTDEPFEYPADFNAEEYFAYDYGISVGFDQYKPCRVLLKISDSQRPYTRALPFHHTQNEIESHDKYSIFEYFIKPTPDFARAILPFASAIEVLEPETLRQKIRCMAYDILKNYKSTSTDTDNEKK